MTVRRNSLVTALCISLALGALYFAGLAGEPTQPKQQCSPQRCSDDMHWIYPEEQDTCILFFVNNPMGDPTPQCSGKDGVLGYYIYHRESDVPYCATAQTGGKAQCSYCPCETEQDRALGRCKLCATINRCEVRKNEQGPGGYGCEEVEQEKLWKGKCKAFDDPAEYNQFCNIPTPTPPPTPTPAPTPTGQPK